MDMVILCHQVNCRRLKQLSVNYIKRKEMRLPANIVKDVPVYFVFDNNDFSEETPSGHGTTHCTNGIIIQQRVCTAKPKPVNQYQRIEKRTNQRILPFVERAILDYPCAPHCGPNRVNDATSLITTATMSLDETHDKDMAWLLARLQPDLSTPDEQYSQVYI
jgi:hypothetical protein